MVHCQDSLLKSFSVIIFCAVGGIVPERTPRPCARVLQSVQSAGHHCGEQHEVSGHKRRAGDQVSLLCYHHSPRKQVHEELRRHLGCLCQKVGHLSKGESFVKRGVIFVKRWAIYQKGGSFVKWGVKWWVICQKVGLSKGGLFVRRWVICQKVGHLLKVGHLSNGVSFVRRQVFCQKMGLSP